MICKWSKIRDEFRLVIEGTHFPGSKSFDVLLHVNNSIRKLSCLHKSKISLNTSCLSSSRLVCIDLRPLLHLHEINWTKFKGLKNENTQSHYSKLWCLFKRSKKRYSCSLATYWFHFGSLFQTWWLSPQDMNGNCSFIYNVSFGTRNKCLCVTEWASQLAQRVKLSITLHKSRTRLFVLEHDWTFASTVMNLCWNGTEYLSM